MLMPIDKSHSQLYSEKNLFSGNFQETMVNSETNDYTRYWEYMIILSPTVGETLPTSNSES